MILEVTAIVVLVPLLYTFLEYVDHIRKLNSYPPGPFPIPVIGNLHQMGLKPYETFRDLAKKYGDVFSISLGMERVVIVNAIEPAREALISKGTDFAGRPNHSYSMDLLSRGYKDIAFADYGPLWTFQRKLGHAALKMYGEGMGNLEAKITMESEDLHARMREAAGKPMDVHMEFGCSVLNVICSMIFGSRYQVDDLEFVEVVKWCNLITEGFSNGDPVSFLPWLRFFPMAGIRKLKEAVALRDPLLRKKLMEHKETFNPDHIRDFTDSLIKSSMDKEVWEHWLNICTNHGTNHVTDDHLEMILFDIFIAGAETTTTTLRWLVTYLLHWPRIQDEVYDEIIREIGTERYPEMKDRARLPLCQATIQESLRLSSLVPLGSPHKAIKDSSINGMNVPKNTQVLFNLWNLQHDPREWNEPENFDPHRWLDAEGKYIPGRHKSFLPFGAGRRACLGEALAKTELFVFFTRFIRDYKVEANKNETFPSLQGRVGVTLAPQPFTAMFIPREQ